jgi:Na+/melibiose symporter-like transporter
MRVAAIGSAVPALLVALLPKCPACLGAYLAVASSLGLNKLDPGALFAVMFGGLVLSLVFLARAARRRHRWPAFAVACVGAVVIVAGRTFDASRIVLFAGVATLYAGAFRIYLSRLGRTMGAACPSK